MIVTAVEALFAALVSILPSLSFPSPLSPHDCTLQPDIASQPTFARAICRQLRISPQSPVFPVTQLTCICLNFQLPTLVQVSEATLLLNRAKSILGKHE